MLEDVTFLWTLRIFAGVAALFYGLMATFIDMREEREGVRRLTSKGKAGFAAALVAFFLSISADVLKDRKEDRVRAQSEAEFRAWSGASKDAQMALTAQQSAILTQILSVRDSNVTALMMQRTAVGQLGVVLDTSRSVASQQTLIVSDLSSTLELSRRAVKGLDSAHRAIETARDAMVESVERGTSPIGHVAMAASLRLDPNDTFLPSFAQRAGEYRSDPAHRETPPYGIVGARLRFWWSHDECTEIPEPALLSASSGFFLRDHADSIRAPLRGVADSNTGGVIPLGRAIITRNSISLEVDTLRIYPHIGVSVHDLRDACVAVQFFFPVNAEPGLLVLNDLDVAWEKALVELGPFDLAPNWQAPRVRLMYSEAAKWWVGRMASEFAQVQKEFALDE